MAETLVHQEKLNHTKVDQQERLKPEWYGKKYDEAWGRLTDERKLKEAKKRAEEEERAIAPKHFQQGERLWQGRKYEEAWQRLAGPGVGLPLAQEEYASYRVFPREEVEWHGRVDHDAWKRLTAEQKKEEKKQRQACAQFPVGSREFRGRKYNDSWFRLTKQAEIDQQKPREERVRPSTSSGYREHHALTGRIDEFHKVNLISSSPYKRNGISVRLRAIDAELQQLGGENGGGHVGHIRAQLSDLASFLGL